MLPSRSHIRVAGPLLVALLCTTYFAAAKKKQQNAEMNEARRAVHALNRLTFGPRPGDAERVASLGVDPWIEQQLHPDKINDSALEARLEPLRTLRMDTRELVENFPPPQLIKAVAEGKAAMPHDPQKRAIYEVQLERYRDKQERKQRAGNEAADAATGPEQKGARMSDDDADRRREDKLYADLKAESLLDLPPDQRMKEILKMSPDEQRTLAGMKGEERQEMLAGMSPQQRETLTAIARPQFVIASELAQGKLLRSIYSERQLDEVLTDFWFNHFNVFQGKGADRYLLTSYERDVIRPHVLGKFEDLLAATAKSPAMLFYLDNWLSAGPGSDAALGLTPRPRGRRRHARPPIITKNRRSGLNENYARELMELHTLGVNGGYTQNDVTEVARVFTGWTLRKPREGEGYSFEPRLHEPGDKVVLGHRIKENGEKEGLEVLRLLAHHPSTAKFVCTKLAMRFVSDEPRPALVERMSETFLKKDGDIREVLRTMFRSPEFWAPEAYRAKVKTPLEFVVSAVRATGADVQNALPLAQTLQRLGMPLYGMQPPTGYSMTAETWVNSAALLGRMNFALALANGKIKGVEVAPAQQVGDANPEDTEQVLATLEHVYLAGDLSLQTHQTILKQLEDPEITGRKLDDGTRQANRGVIAGLLLGSPEFQRR